MNPYKNLNLFTEVDPNNRISPQGEHVDFVNLTENEDAYLYEDMGAGYYSGDFEERFEVKLVAAQQTDGDASGAIWAITNVLNDWQGIIDANEDALIVDFSWNGAAYALRIIEVDGGDVYADSAAISLGTTYYCTIERDEAVGANGTLYLYIYSDAVRETLVDTLTLTLHVKNDFRYFHAILTRNQTKPNNYISGWAQYYEEGPFIEDYRYLFGNPDIVEGKAQYLFGNPDILGLMSEYLYVDPNLILGSSDYLFGDVNTIEGMASYLLGVPTIVSRLPKPIYGRTYHRLSSVEKGVS